MTEDTYQALGIFPVEIDLLNSNVILRAILGAVDFNILAEIPYRPLAFWYQETATFQKLPPPNTAIPQGTEVS